MQNTIYYTNNILYNHGIDYFPTYKIYYRKHQKYYGKFNGQIFIYTKNHECVVDLINTVLHEVCHYIQKQTDTNFKNYKTYSKQLGEWDNPFEAEAREFADEHLGNCLLYLEDKGLIRRA